MFEDLHLEALFKEGMDPQVITVISIPTFKVGADWEIFSERLEQYFLANQVGDDRKVAVLLTTVSEEVYKMLNNISHPDKPSDITYAALIALLKSQFNPKVSSYQKRIQFDSLRQGEESVNDWYVKVKHAASQCKYGQSLRSRVLEKFVVGMRPGPVLDRLCQEAPRKTLKGMLKLALIKEASLKEIRNAKVNKTCKIKARKAARAPFLSLGSRTPSLAATRCNPVLHQKAEQRFFSAIASSKPGPSFTHKARRPAPSLSASADVHQPLARVRRFLPELQIEVAIPMGSGRRPQMFYAELDPRVNRQLQLRSLRPLRDEPLCIPLDRDDKPPNIIDHTGK